MISTLHTHTVGLLSGLLGLTLLVTPLDALAQDTEKKEKSQRSYDAVHERGNTCVFGLLAWCLAEQPAPEALPSNLPLEIDVFGTYKVRDAYYTDEVAACESVGCELDQQGLSNGFSVSYRVTGNGRNDDDFGFGLSVATMPVVSGISNNPGFEGELGPIAAGEGSLGYTNVRVIMRRRHFFYLMRSRFLVSTFGVGMAIPTATSEAGESFTGADGIKTTIGGRFAIQIPITERIEVGLADHWGVWWYGNKFSHSAYMSAYGLHMSVRL